MLSYFITDRTRRVNKPRFFLKTWIANSENEWRWSETQRMTRVEKNGNKNLLKAFMSWIHWFLNTQTHTQIRRDSNRKKRTKPKHNVLQFSSFTYQALTEWMPRPTWYSILEFVLIHLFRCVSFFVCFFNLFFLFTLFSWILSLSSLLVYISFKSTLWLNRSVL